MYTQPVCTIMIDLNAKTRQERAWWRKAVALVDSRASTNIISRKLAIQYLGESIRDDTEEYPIVVGRALNQRIQLRGWIEAQWAEQNSNDLRTTLFLVTVDEDPPFEVVLSPKTYLDNNRNEEKSYGQITNSTRDRFRSRQSWQSFRRSSKSASDHPRDHSGWISLLCCFPGNHRH